MLNNYFLEKSPFCYNYFTTLLEEVKNNNRNFPQAIIFEGNDTKLQYFFTLELAIALNKILNNNPTDEKWIKDYSHPAINIISQIHGKPEDDSSKTVISVKQAKAICSTIKFTSNYYRFYIFFSSKECAGMESELNDYKNIGYKTDIDYSIEPLKSDTFHNATLNTLLKSVEEPPKNTAFVFLTNSRENILSTIASRCQMFKLSVNDYNIDYNDLISIFNMYLNLNYKNAFDFSENLINYISNNQIKSTVVLDKFICYLKDLIKNNENMYLKLSNDIKIVARAIKMINSNVNEKSTIEAMVFSLIRGY